MGTSGSPTQRTRTGNGSAPTTMRSRVPCLSALFLRSDARLHAPGCTQRRLLTTAQHNLYFISARFSTCSLIDDRLLPSPTVRSKRKCRCGLLSQSACRSSVRHFFDSPKVAEVIAYSSDRALVPAVQAELQRVRGSMD